jgi:hypothetical protein
MLGKKLFHLSVPPVTYIVFFPFYILFTKVKKSNKELVKERWCAREKRRHVNDERTMRTERRFRGIKG